jgi:hypothetical protein
VEFRVFIAVDEMGERVRVGTWIVVKLLSMAIDSSSSGCSLSICKRRSISHLELKKIK